VRVTGNTLTNSANKPGVTATCPAGKDVVSGGYTLAVGTAADLTRVAITDSHATSDTVWSVSAIETGNETGTWTLSTFAVCASAP
jgi:hypothetical protein